MRVKKFRPRVNKDKLIYGDGIVSGIVLLAIEEIPYVEIYRGITGKQPPEYAVRVMLEKNNIYVDVSVIVNYSQCVSDIAFKIQESIKYNVESMTEYSVVNVNVNVKGVSFDEVELAPSTQTDATEIKNDNSDNAVQEETPINNKGTQVNV